MRIRVTTNRYEYMGLFKESSHEVEKTCINDHGQAYYYFTNNGREWGLSGAECVVVVDEKKGPIKSDGGSSSYYELEIKNKAGETFKAEVGDVIRAMVGNDFDFGNCVKALRRMYLCTKGAGKAGVSLDYDGNKVKYFIDEILAHHKPRKDNAERSEDCSSS